MKKTKPTSPANNSAIAVVDDLIHPAAPAASYQQLERIAQNLPGVLIEYESAKDGTHQYTYISSSFEKNFGVDRSLIYKITQFLHPDDLDDFTLTLNKAAATLQPFYIESRMILPGRGIVWRSLNCSFSHFSTNGNIAFSGLMMDITPRKLAEEKSNESENRLISLIANLQNGVLLEDENRRLVFTNEMYCEFFGIKASPEFLQGQPGARYVDQMKHQFKDPDYFEEKVRTLLEFQKPELNAIFEMKDGRILRMEYIPISSNKINNGHLWKYTDVTAEKNAEHTLRSEEEKYRSIIDNMNLGLLEIDTEEKILFANQCFCDMSGYEMHELIGERAAKVFAKTDSVQVIDHVNESRRKVNSDAYEIAVTDKRGQVRWWLVSGTSRYNENGDLVGSVGIHLDITAQKQLEIELTEAREQAEQSTRSKEVFLANMSHEIRTPMNAILGMSNQLGKTNLDKKQLFYLDTINSASENLLVIINDILDLSKIEAGKLSLERIAFEPHALIKRSMQALNHRAEEKGLSLTNSYLDGKISEVLTGDPYRLNQVLLNIITNAIKFTERGGVDITLEVLNDTVDNQTISITVTDTGIGMDDKFRGNLFEKFSQEDASVTRQYGGTGLGMSICKELVELMGGQIYVQSEKGVGTCMSFEITLQKGRSEDLPSREIFIADESMLSGKVILVVDDNEINRLVATTILGNYGAVTVEASNGLESVEYLRRNFVDLVLMDIQMPVMNGFEAARIIREQISSTLPVIALTANAIKGDNEKCIGAGMNSYLAKPFKEEDLMKMIAGMLQPDVSLNTTKKLAMIAEDPGPAYYDISEIRLISRGNNAFVEKMLRMFVDQIPNHVNEMRQQFEMGQFVTVGEIAHRIKPTIDNMGVVACKATIREIEKMGKAGEDNGSMLALIDKVTLDVSNAVAAIQKDFHLLEPVSFS